MKIGQYLAKIWTRA